jgi:hypothetical protein
MSIVLPSSNPHEAALAARHADLEARIAKEAQRPIPDPAIIADLKKAKLRIKDSLPI